MSKAIKSVAVGLLIGLALGKFAPVCGEQANPEPAVPVEIYAAEPIEVIPPTATPTEPETVQPPVADPVSTFTAYEAELIGRTIWGEAGGIPDEAERAAVAWCILNRVDAWGITIEDAVTTPHQFQGYRAEAYWGDCPQEHIDLATDVLRRWEAEKQGAAYVGRVLPSAYLYFLGDGAHNHFTTEWQGSNTWGWTLDNPYQI